MAIKYHLPLHGNTKEVISGHPVEEYGNITFVDGPGTLVLNQTSSDPAGITLKDPDINILNFCVSLWVRPTAIPDTELDMIVSGIDQDGERIIQLDTRYPENAFILAALKSNAERTWTTKNFTTQSEFEQFNWVHITFGVFDGYAYFFKDGKFISKNKMNHRYNENSKLREFRITEISSQNDVNGGAEVRGGDFEVSDVRIYDNMLSQKQVYQLSRRPRFHFSLTAENAISSGSFVDYEDVGPTYNHIKKAYDFSTGHIKTNWNPKYLAGQVNFTMSADVLFESVGGGSILELRDGSKPGNPLIVIRQDEGTITCYLRGSTGQRRDLSFTTNPDLKWHNIAMVVNDGAVSIYLDGILKVTSNERASGYVDLRDGYFAVGARNLEGNLDRPYKGHLRNVRWFDVALTESDIKSLLLSGNGSDGEGGFNINRELREQHQHDPIIDGYNLLADGSGEFDGNFWNKSHFKPIPVEPTGYEFSCDIQTIHTWLPQKIKVIGNGLDSFDRYGIYCNVKAEELSSRMYFMIVCFDRNHRRIAMPDTNMVGGSDTTISQPVKTGDQWVYVNNANAWYEDTTRPSTYHNFCYWLDDPEPYTVYRYTRRREVYTRAERANNRIFFENGWPGPDLPAGTPVANSRSGGTYSYIGASNALLDPSKGWYTFEGQTGVNASVGSLRYGTSYFTVGWLLNRDASGQAKTRIKNVKCWNKTRKQGINYLNGKYYVDRHGNTNIFSVSENTLVQNPVHWYPMIGDMKDLGGYQDASHSDVMFDYDGAYFNGQSSDVTIPNLTPIGKTFTVFTWYRIESNERYTHLLSAVDQRDFAFKVGTDSYSRSAYLYTSKTGSMPFGVTIPLGEYVSLALVYSNGVLKQYYNGKQVTSRNVLLDSIPGGEYKVSKRGGSESEVSHGTQRDLLVYSKALSDEDIARLHAMTGPNKNTRISHVQDELLASGEINETI